LQDPAIATGSLFVVAAPSGGGKTSLVRELLKREPAIRLSVSFTTRAPRPGDVDGVDYFFVDEADFCARRDAGEFLEHAYVHGNWYATSARWLRAQIDAGNDVLLEIDWQGAAQVRRLIPSAVGIFILPPSMEVLRQRLTDRGQDGPEVIAQRLANAQEEMRHCGEFDYVIINQDFATAVDELVAVVCASRLRAAHQLERHRDLLRALLEPPA
jgi:guanylate kinase